MNKIATIIATVAACAATACTSYEIDMPANPDAPVVGNEVSSNVIYQANPRFFADNNCLNALTAQLSRIAGMDCDILWVMPVSLKSPTLCLSHPNGLKTVKWSLLWWYWH